MRQRDAIDMLAGSGLSALGPTIWADLGCGDGTFTVALAAMLASGSTIHAMDRDIGVLREVPSEHNGVSIRTYAGDFTQSMWPFAEVDGILMANSLHYVDDQAAFIGACERHMKESRRFLIVEYDSDESNPWVPHPVSRGRLTSLFTRVGSCSIAFLQSRQSRYRRAALYSAMITCIPGSLTRRT